MYANLEKQRQKASDYHWFGLLLLQPYTIRNNSHRRDVFLCGKSRHQRDGYHCAATKAGAEMLKVDNVTGSLAEGKSADLLVINGNPLENIRAIAVENMDVIMKEGYFVKR